ncbi:MAG: response regulator transcription factor [Oceanospirillales bacterium]|uniref:Regulatory LuxR family protein n=1 Tax=Marinobacterium halophilum TaxID=267374 RepID=A0A2P8F3N1_9GAMM|nr:response regulator transcription factor [Marinobacterium halophilum]MBR9827867.1 response regulator transcription factor [Oceanospirillales bacterium]PSL16303.1 regulatory LuxR family protein [Marinobacterium halophilum]
MHVYLYAPNAELIKRWQTALSITVRSCDSFAAISAKTHDPGALLVVHWSALQPEQRDRLLQNDAALIALVDHPTAEEGEALLSRGVGGYANTYIQPELLPQVVETVARGDIWTGPELMQGLLKRLLARQSPVISHAAEWNLSAREQQVLGELVRGDSNKKIARQLDITERTVKAHVSSILEKSGVRDRIELILTLSGQAPSTITTQEQGYEI